MAGLRSAIEDGRDPNPLTRVDPNGRVPKPATSALPTSGSNHGQIEQRVTATDEQTTRITAFGKLAETMDIR